MALFLSPIKDSIKQTLETRQNNAPTDKYGWFNSKTPWLRITSMAKLGDDEEIRKDWILFNGQIDNNVTNKVRSGYSNVYDTTSNRPMPGVTGLSIQNKGSMGSTREATFNYTCWNVDQLNVLEQLYMTPGISVLVEWGWNKDINNDDIMFDVSLFPPMYDKCATKHIIQNVTDSGGHYDGMQGVVSNFSWTLRPDGGFDCSTTLVSMAEMFLEIETHSTSKGITKKTVDNEGGKGDTESALEENIVATITTTAKLLDEGNLEIDGRLMGWSTKMDQDSTQTDDFIDWNGEQTYWVKWEFFEKVILNSNIFFKTQEAEQNCTQAESKASQQAEEDRKKEGNVFSRAFANVVANVRAERNAITTPILDTTDTLINHNPFVLSGDPSVCLLPFSDYGGSDLTITDNGFIYNTSVKMPDDLLSEKKGQKNSYKFAFKDILLNLKFIYTAYKKTTTLNKFLTELLNGVNDACGNYWDFGIQIDEDDPTVITIVDYKTVTDEQIQPFIFKAMKINSILKSVDISTEVTEKIKSIMMLGTNTKPDKNGISKSAGTESNSGYNFYGETVTNMSAVKFEQQKATESDVGGNIKNFSAKHWDITDYIRNIESNVKIVYSDVGYFGGDGVTNENVTALKRAIAKFVTDIAIIPNEYKYEPNKGTKVKSKNKNNINGKSSSGENQKTGVTTTIPSQDKNNIIIPLKLNFSLDGIGGLKFGNVIHIDYLPTRYLNKCYFQITNVSHDISQSEWTTSVETIMRVNMNEITATEIDVNSTSFKKSSYKSTFIPPITTSNVNIGNTWHKRTNTKIASLHPKIRKHAQAFINECKKQGMKVIIASGFRTGQEQDDIYAKGRTIPPIGKIVTKAQAGGSYHNYGLAIDVYEVEGTKLLSANSLKIAKIGKLMGWKWGTDLFGFTDNPHFQMTFKNNIKMLKSKITNNQIDENGFVII